MAEAGFWLLVLLVGTLGCVLGLTVKHFLPLLILRVNGPVPKGTFGWPVLGETLGFLKPHPSISLGTFLQDHCSR